ncbi:XdhC family protein [Minwuia thermotolerans]|uniref:Xanthine dehydrogenase n=1 Tax=Minwuia thermotolerans TaxID=2056226 RepID=A0A2M9G6T8_9PROT|nr:XdhC family protein [Minwuia thermotolerans]PJK31396.1 xanthine dehydrogenase [Minwuia thermotolerans]
MDRDILRELLADRDAKRSVVLATVLESGAQRLIRPGGDDPLQAEAEAAIRADKPATVETDDGQVFLNVFNPPLRMIIVGAVHIAQFLAPMAQMTGYAVTIIDPRQAWATPERFPDIRIVDEWPDDAMAELKPDHRTAIVTLTHDPKLDDPALQAALRSEAFYVGSLGSKRTHAKRVQRLEGAGYSKAEIGRIHAPVGLDIGAKSPAEIAVSVMAQVTAALRGAA